MVTVQEILTYLKTTELTVEYIGETTVAITGFCSLNFPKSDCITWIKHAEDASLTGFKRQNNCLIVAQKQVATSMKKVGFLVTNTPKAVFFSILDHFWKESRQTGIASSAVVESDMIGENVSIGHHCYIGKDVTVGEGTVIENNVSIVNRVTIGKNNVIHSGTVIGTDGFGYFMGADGNPEKVDHYGGVRIGNDVEIGANTCIDRGTIDDTMIESRCKIDNLCHIAHNVQVGEGSMVIAEAVICGSAKLKKRSYIAPGAIVKNQLIVGENAFVGLGAVVTRDVSDNTVVTGVPAKPLRKVEKQDK